MRIAALIALVALAGTAALAFALGLDDHLARAAIGWQRDYQNALAGALRALRAGQPGAVAAFLGICFAYGFFHAVGPGHGKAVIAAYGMATDVPMKRMVGLAALSSLAQATVAVVLVYAAIWLFGGARDRVEGSAALIEPYSMLAIGFLGLFLVWRGARRLLPAKAAPQGHVHSASCGCGHAHAPDIAAVRNARSGREAAALVLGVALRPCTGALFLLILTWRFGLDGLGIAGVYVMGTGTLMVTALAAVLAVALRGGVFLALPRLNTLTRAAPVIEVGAGGLIALLALSTFARML